jgi:hypothetical protein
MTVRIILLCFVLASMPDAYALQPTSLVGLWDSATPSKGGIGSTLEFRADGTFVEATTVIVDGYYRVAGDQLLIDERPIAPDAKAGQPMKMVVDGNVMRVTAPDGSVLRKDRLGQPEAGQPPIVGAWRYRHETGPTAYERYTADGRMFFRLPLKSYSGRYVLKGDELVLTRQNQAGVTMKIARRGDEIVLTTSDRTTTYRRDTAGPWYDREQIAR